MANFHNLSSQQIADDLGTLDLQHKAMGERISAMKDELKARAVERVEGSKFTVTISTGQRVTYDDKAIRAALGDEIVKSYERVSETTTVRIKPTVVFGGEAA